MWTCVEPFWYNQITIFGRLCGQLPDTAKWLPIRTSHTKFALRIRLVSIYGNGAGGVRVQHMSPYSTCELDAPSPSFAGLMRSWYIPVWYLKLKPTKIKFWDPFEDTTKTVSPTITNYNYTARPRNKRKL